MWPSLLSSFLRKFVNYGSLAVIYPNGSRVYYGDQRAAPVVVRLQTRDLARKLLLHPDLHLGEAYMDGTLTVDGDDIYGLLDLLLANLAMQEPPSLRRWGEKLQRLGRGVSQYNSTSRARRNVAHHYDLSSELYTLFLDQYQQYSCAYFQSANDSLEAAQANKKALISAKLLLKSGQHVLDIGCGWGGLAIHLARTHDVHVTGVTLSQEQHRVAVERAQSAGLAKTVQFDLRDYRDISGTFDRIVSVGMFEHVGVPHYPTFFANLRDRLTDDGVALLHTIGRADGPGATNPWIARNIFPGGYSPALSEILGAIERSGLYVTDIEIWRLHYAETLRAWRTRFESNLERVRNIYDERFCRMWRFYLVASELAFRRSGHVVFQIQLARRQDAVPLTRNYLAERPLRLTHSAHAA